MSLDSGYIGNLFGLIGIVISIGLFIWAKLQSDKFESQTNELLHRLNAISKQTKFDTSSIRQQIYDLIAFHINDPHEFSYSKFKSRFEAWDTFGIRVEDEFLRIKILGKSSPSSLHIEDEELEYYIVEAISSDGNQYTNGQKLVCFYYNGSGQISDVVTDKIYPMNSKKFSLVQLGSSQSGIVEEVEVSSIEIFERDKDRVFES